MTDDILTAILLELKLIAKLLEGDAYYEEEQPIIDDTPVERPTIQDQLNDMFRLHDGS